MATTLNLYHTFTPNKLGGIHYHYDSMLIGMQNLMASYKVNATALTLDNYKIQNDNKLLVKTDNTTDWRYLNKLTYCIEEDRTGTYVNARFYHITDTRLQGGYTVCTLEPDYWATYIDKCTIDRRHISRSNINIPTANGYYDPIKAINSYKACTSIATTGTQIKLVFAGIESVKPNVTSIITGQTYTHPILYATEAFSISTDPLTFAAEVYKIANIYNHEISGGLNPAVEVNNIWVVEENMLATLDGDANRVTFNTYDVSKTEIGIYAHSVKYGEKVISGNLRTGGDASSADYKYIVGTYNNGLELMNSNNVQNYLFSIMAKENGLKITVSNGMRTKELTQDFELNLIKDNSTAGYLEQLTYGFNLIEASYDSAKNIASGENIDKGVSQGLQVAKMIMPQVNGGFRSYGDAFTNIYNNYHTATNINKLLATTKYQSVIAEQQKANITGINYDYYVSNFTDTVRNNKIVDNTTPYPVNNAGTLAYIEAQCAIINIPDNAATELENHFSKGMYLVDYATLNKI